MKKFFLFFSILNILACFNHTLSAQNNGGIHILSCATGALEYQNTQDTTCIGSNWCYTLLFPNCYSNSNIECRWTGWSAGISTNNNILFYDIDYDIIQAGNYTLTCHIRAPNSCTGQLDTFSLSVNLVGLDCFNPTAHIEIPDTNICAGSCVQYKNTSTTMAVNLTRNYWSFEGGVPDTAYTYNKRLPPLVCYPTPGRYATKLWVSNFVSFKDSITRYITVLPPPEINTNKTQTLNVKYPDTLHLHTCMPNAQHLQWFPSAGLSCTNCVSPVLSYPYQTEYKCVGWDNEGCEDTCTYRINIDYGAKNIYVPNIFTPNNDGVNDIFEIFTNKNVAEITDIQIFDRWGECVSPPQSPQRGEDRGAAVWACWDGTFRGQIVDNDVYVYSITILFVDGTTETIRGDVTVSR